MTVWAVGRGVILFGVKNPNVLASDWTKIIKEALRDAIYALWEFSLPKHFRRGSRSEYPRSFFVRKRSTDAKKFRKYGHSLPLVNYPEASPPPNKITLELYTKLPPMVRGNHERMKGTWATPRVQEKYTTEASFLNKNDENMVYTVVRQTILRMLGRPAPRTLQSRLRVLNRSGIPQIWRRRIR